ncbi:hypothetical protein [Dishui Lake phycodnavirus 3]|nr:hypothetical protein [Dishui Lake phycodnavirus 3]
MVKLADLVDIANNAKTDAQKNAVGEQVKKMLGGAKACNPEQHLYTKLYTTPLKIEKAKQLYKLGNGAYGVVLYGCLDDKCRTQVAIKMTDEPSAKMEYRIAEKLKGMGVPRMYHFKTCGSGDVLYFEYIEGESLEKWMKTKGKRTVEDYRQLILRLMTNLRNIHKKYPGFRHHDLHWNNILVLKGNVPIIIDFGLAVIEGIENPEVESEEWKRYGIWPGSPQMYDAHYILNIIYRYTKFRAVRSYIADLFGAGFLTKRTKWVGSTGRLLPLSTAAQYLPTYDQILNHPFLQEKKNAVPLPVFAPKPKKVVVPAKPQPKVGTESAVRRAKAVLQKEAEKKKMPPKRPGVAAKPKTPAAAKPKTPRPKVFVNKNGDLKIEKRKCRLYKKEELAKMFKLDPKLTKDQMCKLIKNM